MSESAGHSFRCSLGSMSRIGLNVTPTSPAGRRRAGSLRRRCQAKAEVPEIPTNRRLKMPIGGSRSTRRSSEAGARESNPPHVGGGSESHHLRQKKPPVLQRAFRRLPPDVFPGHGRGALVAGQGVYTTLVDMCPWLHRYQHVGFKLHFQEALRSRIAPFRRERIGIPLFTEAGYSTPDIVTGCTRAQHVAEGPISAGVPLR